MNFPIKIKALGNPGNIMMMYLTACKFQNIIGYGDICNVHIPIFNIEINDIDTSGKIGVHDTEKFNSFNLGKMPFVGYQQALKSLSPHFFMMEGFYQNINNFPDKKEFDYDKIFPARSDINDGGGEGDIVINIRGGEILGAIHPHYTMLPPEFYEFIIRKTKKNPIFYGQLDDSPYLSELKERFPQAKFMPSRGVSEDFDFIRKSKHIVPCLSTFSWMASWMSEAKKIYFPIAGIFSPRQHSSSMLLPLSDERYEFFMFPVYFAREISNYKEYMDPIRTKWRAIDIFELRYLVGNDEKSSTDNELSVFNASDYLAMNPNLRDLYNMFGDVGLFNNYTDNGILKNLPPVCIDEKFYSSKYPDAAFDVAMGRYKNILDHYIKSGNLMEYSLRP